MAFIKSEQNEDQQPFLPEVHDDTRLSETDSRKVPTGWKGYLRWGLEVVMALAIVVLLIRPVSERKTGKSSPVPQFSQKTYTFLENPRYLHEDMFNSKKETLHTLHNWIELSADGRGYVNINDWESFDMDPPHSIKDRHGVEQPVYMMSVFHQLHCLSYLVEHFREQKLEQEVAHHAAHCFDYIRQSLMCNADTSLEGKADADPGWGSKHECKDYDAVLKWANEHDVFKYRKIMPDEAVL